MTDSNEPEAPGRLGVVEAFINTLDVESGDDAFDAVGTVGRWMNRNGLIERTERLLDESDLVRARVIREALRSVLVAQHDGSTPPADARAAIGEAADRARLTLRLGERGMVLEPQAGGLDGALGRLLAISHAAMLDGTWDRLKVCGDDTCRWAYYDRSRNRSRSWCSMRVCGNRTKVRRFRERQAER